MTEEFEKMHCLFLPIATGLSLLLHAINFRGTANLEKLWGILAWSVTTWISLILKYNINKSTVAIELSRTPQPALL